MARGIDAYMRVISLTSLACTRAVSIVVVAFVSLSLPMTSPCAVMPTRGFSPSPRVVVKKASCSLPARFTFAPTVSYG